MSFVLYALGAVVLILALVYGTAISRVMSLRLTRCAPSRLVDADEIPIDLLMQLREHGGQLEELGFRPVGALCMPSPFVGVEEVTWSLAYCDEESRTFASLRLAEVPCRIMPCTVEFASYSSDGRMMGTIGTGAALTLVADLPDIIMRVAGTFSFREQWAHHLEGLSEESSFSAMPLTADEALAHGQRFSEMVFDNLVNHGRYLRCSDGHYRFGLRWALSTVMGATKSVKAQQKAASLAEKEWRKNGGEGEGMAAPEAVVTSEVAAHKQREAVEQNRQSGWVKKLAFFSVSVVLFCLAFGIQFSVQTVVILFGVLLFHELGHALAMRAFGYKDLQILFIPFLGAVAAGKNREAKPHQEIIVFLAGPLPGIVVGMAIIAFGWGEHAEWLHHTAMMMLILNYLNLLPIMPFDGGRVMNLVLFDRFPRLQAVFFALSAIAIGVSASYTGDKVLWIVAIALLAGAPAQFQQASILRAVGQKIRARSDVDEFDEEDHLGLVYSELQKPRFDKWNSESRYRVVGLLIDRLRRKPASIKLASAGLCGYLLCLGLPLGLASYQGILMMQEQNAEYERQVAEIDARLEAASGPIERARALGQAGEVYEAFGEPDKASAHLTEGVQILEAADESELESNMRVALGRLSYYPSDEETSWEQLELAREENLDRALSLRESIFGPESLEVAEVLELYGAPGHGDEVLRTALARQDRVSAIYESRLANDPSLLWSATQSLESAAMLHDELGETAPAETKLRRAVDLIERYGGDGEESWALRQRALIGLSDFYFLHQRYEVVRQILAQRQSLASEHPELADPYTQALLQTDWAWLEYWEGNYENAAEHFVALSEEAANAADPIMGRMMQVPHLLNLATVAHRTGDEARALHWLGEADALVTANFDQSLEAYYELTSGVEDESAPAQQAFESDKRSAEQGRMMRSLIAKL